jgi:hypothetical protein
MKLLQPEIKFEITKDNLINQLINYKRSKILTVELVTKAKLLKKDRITKEPIVYKDVYVKKVINGVINFDYEKVVNKRLAKENKEVCFIAKPRTWGEHVTKAVIVHKDAFYLQIKVQNAKHVYYNKNGVIDVNELVNYLPKKATSRQGTDEVIKIADIAVDNIKKICVDKTEINII